MFHHVSPNIQTSISGLLSDHIPSHPNLLSAHQLGLDHRSLQEPLTRFIDFTSTSTSGHSHLCFAMFVSLFFSHLFGRKSDTLERSENQSNNWMITWLNHDEIRAGIAQTITNESKTNESSNPKLIWMENIKRITNGTSLLNELKTYTKHKNIHKIYWKTSQTGHFESLNKT